MKKYLLLFFLLNCELLFGQSNTFPKYFIQNKDTLGIIFSLKQSQEILNDKKKLVLYKNLKTTGDSLLQKYWILNTKFEDNEIRYLSLIDLYKKNEKENQTIISNRESKIVNLESDLKKCDEQFILKNQQYLNDEAIIGGLRSKQNWLLGGTIGFGVLSVFISGALILK
jgi:hypothetical protein